MSVTFQMCLHPLPPIRKSLSTYHAMGYSSILVMQAGMTFEPKDMDAAMASLGESLQTCQRYGWYSFKFPLQQCLQNVVHF